MSKPTRALREAFAQLDALYARLPAIECKGRCFVACGPIPLTELEARRLQAVSHQKPRTDANNTCIYLKDNRCSVYSARPAICRAWGVLKTLSCMHGCVPDVWLKELDFITLVQETERVGGRVLRTAPEGLTYDPNDSFKKFTVGRPVEAIEADADRTFSLRALHGGRIIFAIRDIT